MSKKIFLSILFTVVFFGNSKSQIFQKTDWGINTTTDSFVVDIQFYSPSIVRIVKSPKDRSFTKESLSVIKTPEKTSFSITQKADVVTLKTQTQVITLMNSGGMRGMEDISATILLLIRKQD